MEFSTDNLTFEVPQMEPEKRLRELILHILYACQTDPKFGKTKLVKLLYYADFTSFRESGQPITGHKYVKLPNGPFPDNLNRLLGEMQRAGEIRPVDDPFTGYPRPQQRYIPLRRAELGNFTAQDIALVDELIRKFWSYSGTEMANMTHGIAWEVAEPNEAIPYEASILTDEEITQEDIDIIEQLVQKYGIDPE